MKTLVLSLLLAAAPLAAQEPDSVLVARDSVPITHYDVTVTNDRYYTRVVVDTVVDTVYVAPDSTPPADTLVAGCPVGGYTTEVNPTTGTALTNAIAAATPGTLIRWNGTTGSRAVTNKSGTVTDSLTLCGTGTLTGQLAITNAHYWRFTGIKVTGGVQCVYVRQSDHNLFRGMEVTGCGQEGFQVWETSSDNVFLDNWVHHIGVSVPLYGEAFYFGSGSGSLANADPANRNLIRANRIGPGVTAEHFDIKRGTTGNVAEDNVSDAAGHGISGVTALYITGGNAGAFRGNTITGLTASGSAAFQVYMGKDNLLELNSAAGSGYRKGFDIGGSGATGNVVKCSNTISGAPYGVTCTP